MSEIKTVQIVEILPTRIWIEDDIGGARHVMLQHEGMEPFCYASFHYHYGYTDNASTFAAAHALALSLGATEPIERKQRGWPEGIGESRREPMPLKDRRPAISSYEQGWQEGYDVGVREAERHHGITPQAGKESGE